MFINILNEIDFFKILEIFFATFVGVWAAFKLERMNKEIERYDKKLEQFIYAQGVLLLQESFIQSIKNTIRPYKEKPNRAGELGVIATIDFQEYLKLSDLKFMLGDNNALALTIVSIQRLIQTTYEHLKTRNELHYKIQKLNKKEKDLYDVKFKNLSDLTEHLFEDIEELEAGFSNYKKEFIAFGSERFKNVKLTELKPVFYKKLE